MPITRTAEHWADTIPEVTCVRCGTVADGYEYQPGYTATFEGAGPFGGPGHVVGTLDEIHEGHPVALFGAPKIQPAPDFHRLTVAPCGCVLTHDDASTMLARLQQAMADLHRREVEATFARHADLLAAADAAGYSALTERYRQAVHARSGDQQGLLVALRTITAG